MSFKFIVNSIEEFESIESKLFEMNSDQDHFGVLKNSLPVEIAIKDDMYNGWDNKGNFSLSGYVLITIQEFKDRYLVEESTDINKMMSDISGVKDVEIGPKPDKPEYPRETVDDITGITYTDNGLDDSKALRFNSDKVEFDTLPWVGIIEMAKNSMYGAAKYDKYNFKKEGESSQYFNCKMRHALKHHLGEDVDKESKVFHLCCEAWNALVELEHILEGKVVDDRHKYSDEFIEEAFKLTEEQKKIMCKKGESDV